MSLLLLFAGGGPQVAIIEGLGYVLLFEDQHQIVIGRSTYKAILSAQQTGRVILSEQPLVA